MKKMIVFGAIALLTGALAASAGGGPVTLAMLKSGKGLLEDNCIECHELDWPWNKVADRAEWDRILTMMENTGAVLDSSDRPKLMEYLLAKSTFQKNCTSCHELTGMLGRTMSPADWQVKVANCSAGHKGLLSAEEIPAVSGFLALGL